MHVWTTKNLMSVKMLTLKSTKVMILIIKSECDVLDWCNIDTRFHYHQLCEVFVCVCQLCGGNSQQKESC